MTDNDEIKNELKEIKKMITSLKNELKGLIEIQQKLVHERLSAPIPPPPSSSAEKTNNKIITISKDLGNIVITGNTYNYNSVIKESAKDNDTNAQWNSSKKAWIMKEECLETLIKKFTEAGLNSDTDFVIKE